VLRYAEVLKFVPADASLPVCCSTTPGLNRQTGSEPVLRRKYRRITLSRRTLPGPLEMRPDNAVTCPPDRVIASSFAQSGRKEVPVGLSRSHSKRLPISQIGSSVRGLLSRQAHPCPKQGTPLSSPVLPARGIQRLRSDDAVSGAARGCPAHCIMTMETAHSMRYVGYPKNPAHIFGILYCH
jgi:hypothetical protein